MPRSTAPKIELSSKVRQLVEEIARQRSSEYRLVVRARLLLACADGVSNYALVRRHKLDRSTVRSWRARWLALAPHWARVESAAGSDADLRELLLQGLRDLPRSGTPATFSAEQIVQIIAVSCEDPMAESARPVSHWTPSELADEVTKRRIVERISPTSVGRFLKSTRSATTPH